MSKYTPPSPIFVKDFSQETLDSNEFDSVVVVSTDLNSLPNFPGYETLKTNKEVTYFKTNTKLFIISLFFFPFLGRP